MRVPDAGADPSGETLVRYACPQARRGDDGRGLSVEDAVQHLVGGHGERDEQAHRRAFIADGRGGPIEPRDDVIDRLLGQFGQIPLRQIMRDVGSGVHVPTVYNESPDGIGCFPMVRGLT